MQSTADTARTTLEPDRFLSVPQTAHPTSAGKCDLPILYRDAAQLGLLWRVDLERARTVLESASLMDGPLLADASRVLLEPWPILGRAVAIMCVWEYRDSTVGRYNELGVGIYARRRGSHPSVLRHAINPRLPFEQGIWVVNLPVTTQAAYVAGVELWGYPKYVAPIETSIREDGCSVRLADEVTIEIGPARGIAMRGFPVVTFTRRADRLIRTTIEVDHRVRWGGAASTRIELVGEGPTAQSIRALGLEAQKPLAAFRTTAFRAILPAGADVGLA